MVSEETAWRVIQAGLENRGDLAELYVEGRVSLQLGLDDQKAEEPVRGRELRFLRSAGSIGVPTMRAEGMAVAGRGGRKPEPAA
jgi:hypothetical protein